MILPLRQRHRRIVCTLGVVLPAVFVFGVAARRTIPLLKPHGISLAVEPHAYGTIVWSDPNVWPGKRISTFLWTDPFGSRAVEFIFDELAGPDVLVYWLSGNLVPTERFPENAQLLGPFSNRERLPFPGKTGGQLGKFLLYSLSKHEVIAESQVVSLEPK